MKTTDKGDANGPSNYFLTTSGDGQVLVWDLGAALASFDDPEQVGEYQWRPVHRIQLSRQDSGTEMGSCHLVYCDKEVGDKEIGNFWASTEEGELVLCVLMKRHDFIFLCRSLLQDGGGGEVRRTPTASRRTSGGKKSL